MTTRDADTRELYLAAPTIDLHCHLRGTMPPSLAFRFASKHNIRLPFLPDMQEYDFSGFDEFLSLYDQIGKVIRAPEDLRDIAYQYLVKVAECGTKYVEFMISPGHSIANGIPFSSQISAISEAIEQAKSEYEIDGCIIVTCVRHRGPDEATEVAEMTTKLKNRHIRGFGLTGNEHVFNVDEFKRAFLIAENSGLGLTAHSGEWLPADKVLETVNSLNLSRVGHGISVTENADILIELVERRIGFEVCLSSNVQLGATESFEVHPARKMIDAGCRLSFSTDDPAYFSTTPKQEVQLAIQHLELTEIEQQKVFDDGMQMAFCRDETKAHIRSQANSHSFGSEYHQVPYLGKIPWQ